MSEAVLAISSHLSLRPVLRTIVESARELTGAPYAALGVPDTEGGFAAFVTSGISDEQWARLGALPRRHGLLGALVTEPHVLRLPDVQQHPRFTGDWPAAHPDMHAFLGVPIVADGDVLGAIYLADKPGGFDDADEEAIRLLAAHAALAISNARVHEQVRELTLVEERGRLARELHDAVAQTLFSLRLTAEAAAVQLDAEPAAARESLRLVRRLAGDALEELRSVMFELRPAELPADGLAGALRKHAHVLSRAHRVPVEVVAMGDRQLAPDVELSLFRVASEAMHNALRHGCPHRVEVCLELAEPVRLVVRDDGVGFDPAQAGSGRRLGLRSMRERIDALDGRFAVESAPGAGTAVRVELP